MSICRTIDITDSLKSNIALAQALPIALPFVVSRGSLGDLELKNLYITRLDYASANLTIENNLITLRFNDAVLELNGLIKVWRRFIIEMSSIGTFKVIKAYIKYAKANKLDFYCPFLKFYRATVFFTFDNSIFHFRVVLVDFLS